MSRDRAEDADELDRDPFACSLCGCYLGQTDRIDGSDFCPDCRRESNTPRDGESRDGAGHVRPVPPRVPPRPDTEADRDE